MAKNDKTVDNSRVNQIFDDLEKYLDFCRDFGYRYDESELYSNKSYVYRQFQKFVAGKNAKNQWDIDLAKLKEL